MPATCLLALALAAGAASAAAGPPCSRMPCEGFDWQALGDGVYAAIRREPPGLLEHANSLVIVNESDVVVVDAQMTASATRELIQSIGKVTSKPVRYVINTHWHDDHVFGNAAYARAYPGVEFVSSTATRDDLETLGRENRRQFVAALPDEIALMRRHLATGKALNWQDLGADGPPLDAAGRRGLESGIAQATAYLEQQATTPVVLPDVLVDSDLVLRRGAREIHVMRLGAAHTRGDVVVWLPRERVLAAGDVVSGIVPMAAGTADLAEWERALDRLRMLEPRVVVPGHGEVAPGDALLARTSALLAAVRERTTAAFRTGATLAEVRARVHLEDLRKAWSGGEPTRELLFALFFEEPAIASVFHRLTPPPDRHAASAGVPAPPG